MKTLLEVLKLSTQYLTENAVANARREAEYLISDALGVGRIDLYMQFDRPLSEEELVVCRQYIKRRAQGEPSQYIHGKVDFLDCCIKVDPNVLIPRQETEILVDKIVKSIEKEDFTGKVLWDVCCGSGCIGIAIKKKLPGLTVVLSDLSEKALAVAVANANENGVDVEFLQGDLLSPFEGRCADYIVSNPPYISESEYQLLECEVKDHEPQNALVAGDTGLEIYERLAKAIPSYINHGGKVWFEIGCDQGVSLSKMFNDRGFDKITLEKDWSGKDRFFFLDID